MDLGSTLALRGDYIIHAVNFNTFFDSTETIQLINVAGFWALDGAHDLLLRVAVLKDVTPNQFLLAISTQYHMIT